MVAGKFFWADAPGNMIYNAHMFHDLSSKKCYVPGALETKKNLVLDTNIF